VVGSILVGNYPWSIVYNSGNHNLYVANYLSNNVYVISDSGKILSKTNVGVNPIDLAYDSANGGIYVANQGSNSVSVINNVTNLVVANITVGNMPSAVAYDSANGNIYVANKGSNSLSVIDGSTNRVVTNIPVGSRPLGIAINAHNNIVYVANSRSNTVSAINGTINRVVTSITVQAPPERVAINSDSGKVYVTTPVINNITLIDTKLKVGIPHSIIVTFKVHPPYSTLDNPPNSGYISCMKNKNITNGDYIAYDIGKTIDCQAFPVLKYNPSPSPRDIYNFTSWSGLVSSPNNPIQFTTKQDGELIANFAKISAPPYVKFIVDAAIFLIVTVPVIAVIALIYRNRGRRLNKIEVKATSISVLSEPSKSPTDKQPRYLSSWISSGKIFPILTLIILPGSVVLAHFVSDEVTSSEGKYFSYEGLDYEKTALTYSEYIIDITFIVILFLYPPYPTPLSIERYFQLRGYANAVHEYEFVVRILYLAVPIFIVLMLLNQPYIQQLLEENFSINIASTLKLPFFRLALSASLFVVLVGILKIILARGREKFRLVYAVGCFQIMSHIQTDKQDESEEMHYLIAGLNSYNLFLRRQMNLEIKDLNRFYSKIAIKSSGERKNILNEIYKAFIDTKAEDRKTLEAVRIIYGKLKEGKEEKRAREDTKEEEFLVQQPLLNKLKDWTSFAAIVIPLAISVAELYQKFHG
jgi:YVTN family beta-propeller protein